MKREVGAMMSLAMACLALGVFFDPATAEARTYFNDSGNSTDMTYYVGNVNNGSGSYPAICSSHGTGSEHLTWLNFASSLGTDWEFDLSTANNGGPHHVTVIFIRDGVNEPGANNDCGYNAAAWSDLNFGGHYVVIHTGEGGDFIETPASSADLYVYTHGGDDSFRIWFHSGTYDGGAGADTITSEWHGDYTTGGESLYGGAGYDTLCDRNGASTHRECGLDSGATDYSTLPADCNAYISCGYPGTGPTIF